MTPEQAIVAIILGMISFVALIVILKKCSIKSTTSLEEPKKEEEPKEFSLLNGFVTLKEFHNNKNAYEYKITLTQYCVDILNNAKTIDELWSFILGWDKGYQFDATFFCNSTPKASLLEALSVKQFLIAALERSYELSKLTKDDNNTITKKE